MCLPEVYGRSGSGDETKRSGGFLQQQQRLRARLTQEVLSQTQLRAWVMAGVSSEHLVMRLKLVEKLAGMIDPAIWRWCALPKG